MAQIKTGIVVKNKMEKAVVVKVSAKVKHPFYKKLVTRTKKFKAHTDQKLKVGQKVKIINTRPFSSQVHFKILEVQD